MCSEFCISMNVLRRPSVEGESPAEAASASGSELANLCKWVEKLPPPLHKAAQEPAAREDDEDEEMGKRAPGDGNDARDSKEGNGKKRSRCEDEPATDDRLAQGRARAERSLQDMVAVDYEDDGELKAACISAFMCVYYMYICICICLYIYWISTHTCMLV